MKEGTTKAVAALVGVGFLLALLTIALPWWNIDAGAQGFGVTTDVKPFDAGDSGETAEMSNEFVDATFVLVVGIVTVIGLLASAAGGGLWLSSRAEQEPVDPKSCWLMMAGGVLFLIAAVLAASTWPAGDLGFWDSISVGEDVNLSAGAGIGWYLALLAGVLVFAAGILGLDSGPSDEESSASRIPAK